MILQLLAVALSAFSFAPAALAQTADPNTWVNPICLKRPFPGDTFCGENTDPVQRQRRRNVWVYYPELGRCEKLAWSGCGTHDGLFFDGDECASTCQPGSETCYAPLDPGQCGGNVAVWGYDAAAGTCKQFTYGGCGGNANRFDSFFSCLRGCAWRL